MPKVNRSIYDRIRLGEIVVKQSSPAPHRFWNKVDKDGPTIYEHLGPCWIWNGAPDGRGYGQFFADKRKITAHRYSWLLHNGQIENDLHVLHHCDNTLCVNPSHLFLGTHQDNVDDKVTKDRQARGKQCFAPHIGEDNGQAKLTEGIVMEILTMYRYGSRSRGTHALGKKYGVSHTLIRYIVKGQSWEHVHAKWIAAGKPKK